MRTTIIRIQLNNNPIRKNIKNLPITPLTRRGTGKTYASAFALKNEKPKKALFIVHREIIAKQAIKSYQKVFGNTKKLALLSGSSKEYEADILFATMSMMAKQETLNRYKPGEFEWICIDDERVIIRTKLEKPSKIKGLALI